VKSLHTALNLVSVTALMVATSTSAFALGGCVDSPENPTLLLALLGIAVVFTPRLYQRFILRK
jgi:XrtJ-associated TM-motif-TM protein